MAGQRQPTDLVVLKGKKHLTKAEIEARKNAEVIAPNDKVKPPPYLTPELKKKFRKLAKFHLRLNQWVEDEREVIQTVQNVLYPAGEAERKVVPQWDFGCILWQFRWLQVRETVLHRHEARPGQHCL